MKSLAIFIVTMGWFWWGVDRVEVEAAETKAALSGRFISPSVPAIFNERSFRN